MRNPTYSMLVGAAVAALLVLPASGADTGWVTWPTKSFDTKGLRIDDVVGDVRVTVQDGPMKVAFLLDGKPANQLLAARDVDLHGSVLNGDAHVAHDVVDPKTLRVEALGRPRDPARIGARSRQDQKGGNRRADQHGIGWVTHIRCPP